MEETGLSSTLSSPNWLQLLSHKKKDKKDTGWANYSIYPLLSHSLSLKIQTLCMFILLLALIHNSKSFYERTNLVGIRLPETDLYFEE